MAEPGDGVRAGRYFLTNAPLAQALERWRHDRSKGGCAQVTPLETIRVDQAVGRVTGRPVWARRSSPASDVAAMDGIAVRAGETLGASDATPLWLDGHRYSIVDTGEPIPEPYDAVIVRERVHFEGDRAEIRAAAAPFHNVRSLGEDVAQSELLLPKGHRLRAVDVAAVAASGSVEVVVSSRPRVAVIPTGDEVRPIGSELASGEVLDTNSLMLRGQIEAAGGCVTVSEVVPDDPSLLTETVSRACASADVVLIVAGSSAGRDDYTATVVEQAGRLSAHGIAVKPGHPVVLGVVGSRPVIGIPGYPVSAALTAELVVLPLLAELEGTQPPSRPRARARLARKLTSTIGMDDWVRVRLGRVSGSLVATPLARGAGMLTSLVRADALLCVPSEHEGLDAGEEVDVELLRSADDIDRTFVCTGSHDLVLDVAASTLRARDARSSLATANVGSLGGLAALRDGLCHAAGSHLLDPRSGDYTLPYVARIVGQREVAVVRLVHRDQGLIVRRGNPLEIATVADLASGAARFVNRQRGAGTRVLLDHRLALAGIDHAAIDGYQREEHTHLGVAAAVAAGRADCGLGIHAAAAAFDLDFVPVTKEPYDLVLLRETLEDPIAQPFLALLGDPMFRAEVDALAGYDASEMGRRIR